MVTTPRLAYIYFLFLEASASSINAEHTLLPSPAERASSNQVATGISFTRRTYQSDEQSISDDAFCHILSDHPCRIYYRVVVVVQQRYTAVYSITGERKYNEVCRPLLAYMNTHSYRGKKRRRR